MIRQIALLAGAIHVCAAVELAEYWDKYRPLPGTERYTPESLVRNFEDIFDEQMLEALHKELEPLDSLAKGSGALRNSKRVTFWLGREREPRCAVERAVKLLEEVRSFALGTMPRYQTDRAVLLVQLTFPKELGGAKAFGIVGCKYWVQRRTTEENVNFHYGASACFATPAASAAWFRADCCYPRATAPSPQIKTRGWHRTSRLCGLRRSLA